MKQSKPSLLPKHYLSENSKTDNINEEDYEPMNYVCVLVPNDLTLESQTFVGRFAKRISKIFQSSNGWFLKVFLEKKCLINSIWVRKLLF